MQLPRQFEKSLRDCFLAHLLDERRNPLINGFFRVRIRGNPAIVHSPVLNHDPDPATEYCSRSALYIIKTAGVKGLQPW
ncbi:hypothetical protein CN934_25295 [Ensifer sp. MMN_5]|nr:hypothetical protein CN934_25295 [Ensifer sp. MMN_5]PND27498.1 hypothetical protein CN933_12555 [Sinorhizobium sp. M4_45]RVQ02576.1 hypothetical protein CN070_09365 [Sinorhizobium meliloti]